MKFKIDDDFTLEEGKSYEFKVRQTRQRLVWEPYGAIDGADWWRSEYETATRYYVAGYIVHPMFKNHWNMLKREKTLKVRELSSEEVNECNKLYLRWDALWNNNKNGFKKNPWVKLNLKNA
jgi:hypothetical protein